MSSEGEAKDNPKFYGNVYGQGRNINHPYPSRRPGYKPKKPMPNKHAMKPDERDAAKHRFLDAMAQTNIITNSCANAGISRQTYTNWHREGYLTDDELLEAYGKYQDMLRGEIARRTFVGTPKPMVVGGRLVYDKAGNQVTINTIDSRLLIELAKRSLPEWKEEQKTIVVHTMEGMPPEEYMIVFDARDLIGDEFSILQSVAFAIKDRKNGVVNSGSGVEVSNKAVIVV